MRATNKDRDAFDQVLIQMDMMNEIDPEHLKKAALVMASIAKNTEDLRIVLMAIGYLPSEE